MSRRTSHLAPGQATQGSYRLPTHGHPNHGWALRQHSLLHEVESGLDRRRWYGRSREWEPTPLRMATRRRSALRGLGEHQRFGPVHYERDGSRFNPGFLGRERLERSVSWAWSQDHDSWAPGSTHSIDLPEAVGALDMDAAGWRAYLAGTEQAYLDMVWIEVVDDTEGYGYSYEELDFLESVPVPLDQSIRSRLPVGKVPRQQTEERCVICQCEYEAGEETVTLGCAHQFHNDCAAGWFEQSHKLSLIHI
eukprot:TRINITY_DN12010_c0_g1_i3.p1 TRINITY_DN12010_c0_g1~~TRINITY_DN12010_c0_g1_i3.p1  ORF type:complete len:250 (+),score=8.80 TRINITY_DN12010_c0_g1_i3:64-813(+)